MPLKKKSFSKDEVAIFDDAVIYKRGDYWHFRQWLANERKYARFSLKTRNKATAIDKAKLHYHQLQALQLQGKTYFSITTKDGVELYLEQRQKDVEAGLIVKGRYTTVKTHLEHWLNFIKRDTKLKELERTDCENYFYERTKHNKKLPVSRSTVENEQSTINAMLAWLYKKGETYIDGFDFKKLPRVDKGNEDLRRASFTDSEITDIGVVLENYIAEAKADLDDVDNLKKAVVGYYLLVAIASGLRTGEQQQLMWQDVNWLEHLAGEEAYSLVEIRVRAETSKVRKTRKFIIKDYEYFEQLSKMLWERYGKDKKIAERLVFSFDGDTRLSNRLISYHFDKVLTLAGVKNRESRDLVPYSFRHYFITQRVNSNLSPTAVAEMCGTSVTQIEKTYYHTTKDKMISNALSMYYIKDGRLIPS